MLVYLLYVCDFMYFIATGWQWVRGMFSILLENFLWDSRGQCLTYYSFQQLDYYMGDFNYFLSSL